MNYGLKDAWGNRLNIGAAVNGTILSDPMADITITRHFSSITAENAMKFGIIHPEEDFWNWGEADFIADYARQRKLKMRGHCLLWHKQTPIWPFLSGKGSKPVSKLELFKRFEDHVTCLAQRYNDVVYSWDVLHQVIDTKNGDDKGFTQSSWYQIGGREIYEHAFKVMRQVSPSAKLIYCDNFITPYETDEVVFRFISEMLDSGVPIDGIGIEGHFSCNFPDEEFLRSALKRYSTLGIDIEFTAVDVSTYDWNEKRERLDFFTSMPEDRLLKQAQRYEELFRAVSEFPAIKSINTWGIADNYTWLDSAPVFGRKNWPLLFNKDYNPKEVVSTLIEMGEKERNKEG